MTAPVYVSGRIHRDKRADAMRAARRVVDEGVRRKDAQRAFGIGWTYLKEAITQLRAERAREQAMTCRYHDEPVETCMSCLGRWHGPLAQRLLREGASAASLASALRFAIAEITLLEGVRDGDCIEVATTYATMRLEIEALRCGDLVKFLDGELDPARADAFRFHLGTCESCQRDLEGHMQLDAKLSELAAAREPTREP